MEECILTGLEMKLGDQHILKLILERNLILVKKFISEHWKKLKGIVKSKPSKYLYAYKIIGNFSLYERQAFYRNLYTFLKKQYPDVTGIYYIIEGTVITDSSSIFTKEELQRSDDRPIIIFNVDKIKVPDEPKEPYRVNAHRACVTFGRASHEKVALYYEQIDDWFQGKGIK